MTCQHSVYGSPQVRAGHGLIVARAAVVQLSPVHQLPVGSKQEEIRGADGRERLGCLLGIVVAQRKDKADLSRHLATRVEWAPDEGEGYVWVDPGVTWQRLDRMLARRGRSFPPDPASGAMCTLGGMVATNAAGALPNPRF